MSFRFPLFSISNGWQCDHRAVGVWVLYDLQLSVAGESVDGAAMADGRKQTNLGSVGAAIGRLKERRLG